MTVRFVTYLMETACSQKDDISVEIDAFRCSGKEIFITSN